MTKAEKITHEIANTQVPPEEAQAPPAVPHYWCRVPSSKGSIHGFNVELRFK